MCAIFLKDLRLLLKDRSALILTLIAPLIMITVITQARYQSAHPPLPLVPVVNLDGGPAAAAFVEILGGHANVVEMDQAAAETLVRDQHRAAAALVFPSGMSKRYLQGRPSEVNLLTDPAQAAALNNLRAMLLVMEREAAELADPLHEAPFVYREQNLTGTRLSPKALEQNVPGFTVMFVLLAAVFGTAAAMHDEIGAGTLTRLLVAPVGFASLLTGKLGVRFVIGCAQAIALLYWGRLLFGISLGSSVAALLALCAAMAFAAAALGLLVAAVSSTREQAMPLSLATTLSLAAVGGLWWPISLVPEWLQRLGQCFFPTWAMYGMTDVILRDRGLAALSMPLAVMLVQGGLCLAVGLWLFRQRHATG
ncbi:MAG: ABC transporter permease [Candidatus Binatia bacterium]